MVRDSRLPLTETVYYILLALASPAHGYLIMSRVEQMSGGQVKLAPGTLYGALANLLKQGMITQLPSEDPRRKVYQVTEDGARILGADTQRMAHMISVFNSAYHGGETR